MTISATASVVVVLAATLSSPLAAQRLNHPTPGIPHAPSGKPNLTTLAPRMPGGKPGLSGLLKKISPKYRGNVAADLKRCFGASGRRQ